MLKPYLVAILTNSLTMRRFLLFLVSIVLLGGSCRKSKPKSSVDQLPPETQTGANTFGCLVNGQAFLPGGTSLTGGSLSSNYQFLNGGYYFRLAAISRNNTSAESKSIGVFTDSLKLAQGSEYTFSSVHTKGLAYALYGYSNPNTAIIDDYETNPLISGKLTIKKLDTLNQIVSGTFWFDAVNAQGQKAEIREGRFDVRYTR